MQKARRLVGLLDSPQGCPEGVSSREAAANQSVPEGRAVGGMVRPGAAERSAGRRVAARPPGRTMPGAGRLVAPDQREADVAAWRDSCPITFTQLAVMPSRGHAALAAEEERRRGLGGAPGAQCGGAPAPAGRNHTPGHGSALPPLCDVMEAGGVTGRSRVGHGLRSRAWLKAGRAAAKRDFWGRRSRGVTAFAGASRAWGELRGGRHLQGHPGESIAGAVGEVC